MQLLSFFRCGGGSLPQEGEGKGWVLWDWDFDLPHLLCRALSILSTSGFCWASLSLKSLSLISTSSGVLELAWMYSQGLIIQYLGYLQTGF